MKEPGFASVPARRQTSSWGSNLECSTEGRARSLGFVPSQVGEMPLERAASAGIKPSHSKTPPRKGRTRGYGVGSCDPIACPERTSASGGPAHLRKLGWAFSFDEDDMRPRQWWDEVPYDGYERQPFSMEIEASKEFPSQCGFVPLRERHRVKAGRRVIPASDEAE